MRPCVLPAWLFAGEVGAFTIVSEIGGQGERYLTLDDFAVWAHGSRLPPRQ